MEPFTYDAFPGRVVFGAGTLARVPAELEQLGVRRPLLIATGSAAARAEELRASLGDGEAGVLTGVRAHVPIDDVLAARATVRGVDADGIVAIGGGSVIGLAKAVAAEMPVTLLAVPTTYSGSEMTPLYGVTDAGTKHTVRDPRVLPRAVVYDPELTLTLPASATAASAFNAIAHCVEAFYGPGANPLTSLICETGLGFLTGVLPDVVADPEDLDSRSDLLYGAHLAGTALAVGGTALHHRVCHVLGGSFGLGHADANAVMLPHVLRFNAPAIPDEIEWIADAIGADDPAARLADLAAEVGAPTSLSALGLAEADLDEAARRVVAEPPANPRPVDFAAVRALLADAWRRP